MTKRRIYCYWILKTFLIRVLLKQNYNLLIFNAHFPPMFSTIFLTKQFFQVFFLSFKLELWEPACRWDQVCVPDPDIGGLTGKPEAVGGGQHSVLVDQSPATNNLKFVQLCKQMYTVILYIFILGFSRMKWIWLLQGWSRVFLKWPTKSRAVHCVQGMSPQVQGWSKVFIITGMSPQVQGWSKVSIIPGMSHKVHG